MKYILIMFICSLQSGNSCKFIPTEISEFKDHYDCAVYGYNYSHELISEFSREFVNQYSVYVQFMCKVGTAT
jgi:hypothetical protein|tara:strand:- start:248 stop:463 length:216 start_codon:yes stop_codon:yes gene_type:complete